MFKQTVLDHALSIELYLIAWHFCPCFEYDILRDSFGEDEADTGNYGGLVRWWWGSALPPQESGEGKPLLESI